MNLLDFTVPSHPIVETLRVLLAIGGVVLFAAGLVRWLQKRAKWSPAAAVAVGLQTAMQEYDVMGEPMKVWRWSLLLIATHCLLVHLYRLQPGEVEHDL